jgi:1,4-dihydroxy-2-naphthoate octaprenyltransferase
MAIMQVTDKSKSFYKGFWQVADPKIWVASTVPMVVGVLLSVSYAKEFRLFWMVLAFVGVYLIEIGKNAINECVDYISGADRYVDTEHRTPFSGGKKTIVDGLLTVNQSAWIGVVTMALAAVIGIVFCAVSGAEGYLGRFGRIFLGDYLFLAPVQALLQRVRGSGCRNHLRAFNHKRDVFGHGRKV